IEEDKGSDDGGLKPEVKTDVGEGDNNGNNVVEKNVVEGGDNVVDTPSKIKDNEDVTPAPNIVDDDVAPGPQGIVGDQGYSDDEGHHGDIPDDTNGASGGVDED
ncbi:MAG: hypothetical protein U9Q69_02100, partial [Nanoarchaeota archaeon]|nr:hypothetical protein [Nanoarchaeota archaeon]